MLMFSPLVAVDLYKPLGTKAFTLTAHSSLSSSSAYPISFAIHLVFPTARSPVWKAVRNRQTEGFGVFSYCLCAVAAVEPLGAAPCRPRISLVGSSLKEPIAIATRNLKTHPSSTSDRGEVGRRHPTGRRRGWCALAQLAGMHT